MDAKEYAAKVAIKAIEAVKLCPKQNKCGPAYKLLCGTKPQAEAPYGCEVCIRKKWTAYTELSALQFRVLELLSWEFFYKDSQILRASNNDFWRERATSAAEYKRRSNTVLSCTDAKALQAQYEELRKALKKRCKGIGEGNINAD